MRHLSVDIETYSSVDLMKGGLYKYVQASDFQILLFAYSFDGEQVKIIDLAQGESLPVEIVNALQDPEVIKHAYNAAFEWCSLNKFYYSPLEQWRCTMLNGLYCGYTAGLAATGAALNLTEDKRKLGTGTALIKTFCVPQKPTVKNGERSRILPHHEPEKWRLFKEYCLQDVVTEMEIERRLSSFSVPEREQRLWELDQRINAYGISVDSKFIEGALFCSGIITGELIQEAVNLSGVKNPQSVQQLSAWLEKETGEEVLNLQKDTVKEMLVTTDSDAVRRMLEIRQELSKTSVRKYSAMAQAVCQDGRIRDLLQFYGASRTGRWSGKSVQVQNLPRNHLETLTHARNCVKEKKFDALKIVYGNVPDTLSQLIRTAFIPTQGHIFLVADYSAIEARVIAWLAGEGWRLEVFSTHGNIYEASASQMFRVPIEKISKGNPEYELRQKGKVAELALGYGGSSGALITMGALKMGLTKEELPEIVKRWRASNRRIVELWYSLERSALEVIRTGQAATVKGLLLSREFDYDNKQDFFTITLPSRRKLFYAHPFIQLDENNRDALYYSGIHQKTGKWEVIDTYGGKLTENIVQAIARDCLAESLIRLKASGYKICTHIHDEVILEVPAEEAEIKNITDIMSYPMPWATGLLLKAEGYITEYYKKE